MNEPVRPEDLRVSDAEREDVADPPRVAQEVGRLDIHEFDERVRSVWAARTRGELERVTVDLLAPPPRAAPARRPGRQVFSDTGGGILVLYVAGIGRPPRS